MPDTIQLPSTPDPTYLDIARNCSCLVNVASQMAQDWVTDGLPKPEDFKWTPKDLCPYTSDLFGQFDFRNVELIWSDFYYQDGLKTLGPVLEPFGFVVLLHDKAFLIFRGTRGDVRPDVQADKDIQKTPYASGGNVSRGFWRVFDGLQGSLRGQLKKVKDSGHDLVISGHSLGSTLATFAVPLAADPANGFGLPVTAYPQASPKVGGPDFVKYYNGLGVNTYRLVNTEDSVPKLPVGGYAHVGIAVEFTAPYFKVDESGKTTNDEGKIHNPCCSYAYALKQVGTEPYIPVNPSNTDGTCKFPVPSR